jgi:RNA polymerase sigma-70 factor (ECF subfamily)
MATIDPAWLGRLFDALAPALRLYARQWCGDADAEDLVQEAFVRLAGLSYVPEQTSAWLHRVVRNEAISRSRSRARRQRREGHASGGEAWFSGVDEQLDAQTATRVLAEIEPDCREVIIARIWGELTFDQIAQLQGCSLTTAHRRYHDGLARLQARLEEPCTRKPATTPMC